MSQHQIDPSECLLRIRELVATEQVRRHYRNGTLTPWEIRELVDMVYDLDVSLSRGDYLPGPWYVPEPTTVEQPNTEQARWDNASTTTGFIEAGFGTGN